MVDQIDSKSCLFIFKYFNFFLCEVMHIDLVLISKLFFILTLKKSYVKLRISNSCLKSNLTESMINVVLNALVAPLIDAFPTDKDPDNLSCMNKHPLLFYQFFFNLRPGKEAKKAKVSYYGRNPTNSRQSKSQFV